MTVYFFEVWNLELTEDFFEYISYHPAVFTTDKLSQIKTDNHVADHCRMLNPKLKLPQVQTQDSGRIRISMSALVNLTHKGKSCLLIQKGVVKPFGGAYQYEDALPVLSAKSDDVTSKDLRFTIDACDLVTIEEWFHKKIGRELTPHRELVEELSLENTILPSSKMDELIKSLK